MWRNDADDGAIRRGWIFVYPGSLRNSVSAW